MQILAQQRAARANEEAATRRAENTAEDPAAFFESLPPALRQQVLAETDDETIAQLPANLATEARRLRERFDRAQAARVAEMHDRLRVSRRSCVRT